MWFQRARCSTIGAFHQSDATVQKLLEFDGNHSGKRAFGRFGGLLLVSHSLTAGRMLGSRRGCLRRVLRLIAGGGDAISFHPIRTSF
jgi:hypothetical protein